MDIQLARTFLAVVASGNFIAAAASLHVTQSAVSLRVKRLEEQLGQTLFERGKGGVSLTPAGRRFERFAISMVRIWREARHQVAVPDGFRETLIVGGQYNLLPRFVMRWLDRLEAALPEHAFRVEAGMPDRLVRLLLEGGLDMAVLYTPQLRPGFVVEPLFEEELILVATDPDYGPAPDERYVFMDWGPEFTGAHAAAWPDLATPRFTYAIGALGLNAIIRKGRAAYFPARVVREEIEAGRLHPVAGAPTFSYPCYVVYNAAIPTATRDAALKELRRLVALVDAQQDEVLNEMSRGG